MNNNNNIYFCNFRERERCLILGDKCIYIYCWKLERACNNSNIEATSAESKPKIAWSKKYIGG